MTSVTQSETRRLSVSPHIIYSLIKNQAGTLAKAVLECVMNSIDAGATKVDIKVTPKTLLVVDNGAGFATKDAILSCFEVFGFEHKEGDRTYGQFGIGRAQLWNFCTTKWRTHSFSMDVDIKNKGLDYRLDENLTPIKGLTIEGVFYSALKASEVLAFEQEFAALATYAQVPVTVNGKLVSKDPSKEKWTHETPEAWINIRESGNLQVYNLGVFVREYPSYQVGCGGKVVTKPGVRLSLNMARNDIILTECKVWKKIKPFLQGESDKRIKDSTRKLSGAEVANLAMRFVAGEVAPDDVKKVPFITDISGKSYTIEAFLRKTSNAPVITGPKDSQVLDRVNQEGLAFVIADETLYRFGVSTPSELGELFTEMANERRFTHPAYKLHGLVCEDDASKITSALNSDFKVVPHNELSIEEKAIVTALNGYASRQVGYAMSRYGRKYETRKVSVGTSDVADAWTDGAFNIVYNRSVLKVARRGLSGMQVLINLMVHEYLHDENTAGSHSHDTEFYQAYHDLTTSVQLGDAIAHAAQFAFRDMMKIFREKDVKMIKPFKDGVDDIQDSEEMFGGFNARFNMEDVVDARSLLLTNAISAADTKNIGNAGQDPLDVISAPVRRKPGRPRKAA